MQLIVNGHVLPLKDLDASTNNAFVKLHAAYLCNQPLDWADFEDAANAFFNRTDVTASLQDDFFTNFTGIWRNLLASGQFHAAEEVWRMALRPALKWENQNKGRFIHKGTPFYFWGMTALLSGDLDRAFVLIHQAVDEDCRTHKVAFPDTPAFAFTTLNYVKPDQALRPWVLSQAEHLSGIIQTYCGLYDRAFTLAEFQRRFLINPPSMDTTFLFVYTLARLSHLQKVPTFALDNGFAGQLEMNLLFDLTLVIDAAIKAKNPTKEKFIDHAARLAEAADADVSRVQLGEINGQFNRDFDVTLAAIQNGSFTFRTGAALTGVANDIAVAYGIRNHAAHNISSASTIWKQFGDIKQRLFNVLFLTVESLY